MTSLSCENVRIHTNNLISILISLVLIAAYLISDAFFITLKYIERYVFVVFRGSILVTVISHNFSNISQSQFSKSALIPTLSSQQYLLKKKKYFQLSCPTNAWINREGNGDKTMIYCVAFQIRFIINIVSTSVLICTGKIF